MDPIAIAISAWRLVRAPVRAIASFLWSAMSCWPLRAYLVCALAVTAAIFVSGHLGWHRGIAYQKQIEARMAVKADRAGKVFIVNLAVRDAAVATQFTADLGKTRTVFDLIDKEVSTHVTPDIDRRYPLPCILVRVHDASILGVDPSALAADRCPSDDAPAPTATSAFSQSEADWGLYTSELLAQLKTVTADYVALRDEYTAYRDNLIAINGGK